MDLITLNRYNSNKLQSHPKLLSIIIKQNITLLPFLFNKFKQLILSDINIRQIFIDNISIEAKGNLSKNIKEMIYK